MAGSLAKAASILLSLVAAFFIDASDAGVGVYTGHDDPLCKKPSTVSIDEGGCAETGNCTAYTVGGGTTYYGQRVCGDSRESYLESTFGDAPLFMEQHYEDAECTKLKSTRAYLADGECHYFTAGVMKIWVAEDHTMAALTVAGSCDSDDWSVFMDLNVTVNTGVCIAQGTESVMYALAGNLPPASTTLGSVTVSTGYDDSSCESPSTATIAEGECGQIDGSCTEFTGVGGWGNTTYYGGSTCSSSRVAYLQSAFGDSPVFMIEYYEDAACNKLVKSEVYRADGKCHYSTYGLTKMWVSDDNSMTAVLSSSYCDSTKWSVVMDLNVSVNTGVCIAQSDYGTAAVKHVLLGAPTSTGSTPSDPIVNFGDILWPDRDQSLCTRPATCRYALLEKLDNRGFLRLLELSDALLGRGGLFGRLPLREYTKGKDHLPDLLLKLLFQSNDRVARRLETVCGGVHLPIRSQELDDCRCVHDLLIRGISTARKVQSLAGIQDWEFKFCDVLMQREQVLYQETRSILTDACGDRIGNYQRQAYLDSSILC